MRETIKGLLEYIEKCCVPGRDDQEISELYQCVSVLYFAIEAIKRVEKKSEEFDEK